MRQIWRWGETRLTGLTVHFSQNGSLEIQMALACTIQKTVHGFKESANYSAASRLGNTQFGRMKWQV